MSITDQKLDALRARLLAPERQGGALLVVYPPQDELAFRTGYDEIIRELQARGVQTRVLDLRTLVFEVLEDKGLLHKALQLDAAGSRDIRQNLAGMVQRETLRRVQAIADQDPQAVVCCIYTAALYPWMSYSALLEEVENSVPNTLVIPFPGLENGPALHFMGAKDGYNYRAARV